MKVERSPAILLGCDLRHACDGGDELAQRGALEIADDEMQLDLIE